MDPSRHTRFVHCIGTAHQTYAAISHVASELRKDCATTKGCHGCDDCVVPEQDIVCVTLAALMHDLGHPMYGHDFDAAFLRAKAEALEVEAEQAKKKGNDLECTKLLAKAKQCKKWTHEHASRKLVAHLWDELGNKLRDAGLNVPDDDPEYSDLKFVQELIDPPKDKLLTDLKAGVLHQTWSKHIKGRPVAKAWMFELVSNWRSGVDTDKLDYFARDRLYCGFDVPEFNRYLLGLRVANDDLCNGIPTLSLAEKFQETIVKTILPKREENHREIYQHKTAKKLKLAMVDVMLELDKSPEAFIRNKDGKKVPLSDIALTADPVGYLSLTQSWVEAKMYESAHESAPLHHIWKMYKEGIIERKGFKHVTDFDFSKRQGFYFEGIEKFIQNGGAELRDQIFNQNKVKSQPKSGEPATPRKGEVTLSQDQPGAEWIEVEKKRIFVSVSPFHMGMKTESPLKHIRFHNKSGKLVKPDDSFKIDLDMHYKFSVFFDHRNINYSDDELTAIRKNLSAIANELLRKACKSPDGNPLHSTPMQQWSGAAPSPVPTHSATHGRKRSHANIEQTSASNTPKHPRKKSSS